MSDLFTTSRNRQQTPDEEAFGIATYWVPPASSKREDENELQTDQTELAITLGNTVNQVPSETSDESVPPEFDSPRGVAVSGDETVDEVFLTDQELSVDLLSL